MTSREALRHPGGGSRHPACETLFGSSEALDRANVIEFRVTSDDLVDDTKKSVRCEATPFAALHAAAGGGDAVKTLDLQ